MPLPDLRPGPDRAIYLLTTPPKALSLDHHKTIQLQKIVPDTTVKAGTANKSRGDTGVTSAAAQPAALRIRPILNLEYHRLFTTRVVELEDDDVRICEFHATKSGAAPKLPAPPPPPLSTSAAATTGSQSAPAKGKDGHAHLHLHSALMRRHRPITLEDRNGAYGGTVTTTDKGGGSGTGADSGVTDGTGARAPGLGHERRYNMAVIGSERTGLFLFQMEDGLALTWRKEESEENPGTFVWVLEEQRNMLIPRRGQGQAGLKAQVQGQGQGQSDGQSQGQRDQRDDTHHKQGLSPHDNGLSNNRNSAEIRRIIGDELLNPESAHRDTAAAATSGGTDTTKTVAERHNLLRSRTGESLYTIHFENESQLSGLGHTQLGEEEINFRREVDPVEVVVVSPAASGVAAPTRPRGQLQATPVPHLRLRDPASGTTEVAEYPVLISALWLAHCCKDLLLVDYEDPLLRIPSRMPLDADEFGGGGARRQSIAQPSSPRASKSQPRSPATPGSGSPGKPSKAPGKKRSFISRIAAICGA